RETIERAYHEHASYRCEHQIVRRSDGALRTIQSRGEVVCDEHGQPIRMVGTAQDVTERNQVQGALAQYVALVVESEDAIITKSLNGTILTWNPGAERLYGYTAEEMEGQPIAALFPPDQHDEG